MPLVTVKLGYAMVAAIDAMRGPYSREKWLYCAARQVIEDGLRPWKQGDVDEEAEEQQ